MTKSVIIDYRTDREAVERLNALGLRTILTKPIAELYPEIEGHADIQAHAAFGKIICAPQMYEYYRSQFPDNEVICGGTKLKAKYPYDIAYNACRVGECLICNEKYTDSVLLNEYKKHGYKILNTKQGYSKCSICVVNESAAITADNGICRLLCENGIDTLKITPGHISLYGMDGFIGGASGLLGENRLAFNGSISFHPDSDIIRSFCAKHGVEIIELSEKLLTDIGSILLV